MSVILLCSYCGKEIDKYKDKYITYNEKISCKNTCKKVNICTNCALNLLEKSKEKSKI
ncbi:TPA: DNA-directed RNA polymerase [Clostridioides difficile]|uniref:DNA-directed RNA polymerase n=1 Tax=Clostridioides difficile TaxID=1496 RepID=UPI00093A1EB3|nr:DNA-directed RNA polymerase [Clostridioides difficile]EIJ0739828.1 DNA-directed RNA polymerase [Clostridioides difficile]EIS9524599.1 DNA-directed RNA polymerase [Clostridioides difficile]EIS9626175.1 DNA-directed RNA polymerase [Clostridioides difficile]KAK2243655.1 DNA-directed RNA polymerase [Clostridioides difficile]MBY1771411.1 DNA-directed RNA polymerase [Clostridioides difficile]